MDITAFGKFVKNRVSGMPKHGQYRGKGSLTVTDYGLGIGGKHVYSLGQRWTFGLIIALVATVVTFGTFAPGILLLYPIVEYLWLKRGNQLIPYDRIIAFRFVPAKQLLAVSFRGTPWESPAVLRSADAVVVFNALSARLPGLASASEGRVSEASASPHSEYARTMDREAQPNRAGRGATTPTPVPWIIRTVTDLEKAIPVCRIEMPPPDLEILRLVQEMVGYGGMWAEFLARERPLGRMVVLKVVTPHCIGYDVEVVLRDARIAAQLTHPNLLRMYGILRWEHHGLALMMQHVEGETLVERIGRVGPMPVGETARVLRDLAAALAYMHRLGLVHRRVEPKNVVIETDSGRVLLGEGDVLSTAEIIDSIAFPGRMPEVDWEYVLVAPEWKLGNGRSRDWSDARSDIFCLGLVAYTMLTGESPLSGRSLAYWWQHHDEALPPLRMARPDVPVHLERVIGRCMEVDPARRWADAGALLAALDGGSPS